MAPRPGLTLRPRWRLLALDTHRCFSPLRAGLFRGPAPLDSRPFCGRLGALPGLGANPPVGVGPRYTYWLTLGGLARPIVPTRLVPCPPVL